MTREEAIEILEEEAEFLYGGDEPYNKIAFDMAIEALKHTGKLNNPDDSLLTADSEACKKQKSKLELISRAEAIEAVRLESAKRGLLGRGDILDILSALPSAYRPKGEWNDIGGVIRWGCSLCHYAYDQKFNFCPNCGADMRSE